MIEQRLRTHVESLATPVTLDDVVDPTYTTVTIGRAPLALASPRPRLLGRPLAWAAAIVAVVAAVAVVADDRPPSLARPGAWSMVPEAAAVFAAPAGADRTEANVSAVVPYRGGLVAVGSVVDGSDSVAAAWRSDDGRTWARVSSDSFVPVDDPLGQHVAAMVSVTVKDGRLVALGVTTASSAAGGAFRPAVWTSDDGLDWQRHDLPQQEPVPTAYVNQSTSAMPSALVATPHAVLAFLTVDGSGDVGGKPRTRMFSSPDGVAWSPIDAPGLDGPGVTLLGAVADRGRAVVFGSEGVTNGRPAAWTSADDGATWQPVSLPYESDRPYGEVTHVVTTSSGLLLLGTGRTRELSMFQPPSGGIGSIDGDADTIAWLGRDGSTFEPLDTSMLNTARWNLVTAATQAGGGALVAQNRTDLSGETTHVITWSADAGFVEEDAGGLAVVTALVDHGGGFLAMARASNAMPPVGDLGTVVWRASHR